MTTRPESSIDHTTTRTAPVSSWRAVLRGLGDGSLGSAFTVALATGSRAENTATDAQPDIGARGATSSDEGLGIIVEPVDAMGTPKAGTSAL